MFESSEDVLYIVAEGVDEGGFVVIAFTRIAEPAGVVDTGFWCGLGTGMVGPRSSNRRRIQRW